MLSSVFVPAAGVGMRCGRPLLTAQKKVGTWLTAPQSRGTAPEDRQKSTPRSSSQGAAGLCSIQDHSPDDTEAGTLLRGTLLGGAFAPIQSSVSGSQGRRPFKDIDLQLDIARMYEWHAT